MDWVYCRPCPRHEHRGLLISMGFAGKTKSRRADSNRLPLLQLRVIIHVLQGFARSCKTRISKPYSFLWFAQCCTVLRSQWCRFHRNRTAFVCSGTLSPDEAVMARIQAVSCETRCGHQYNDAIPDEGIGRAFL